MAHSDDYLAVVQEWKREAFNFSNDSDDALSSVFLKAFDSMSTVLNSSTHRKIQKALATLEGERLICLRFEETNDPSIRNLMYGIIESLHLTLIHLTEYGDPSDETLSTIEEWKRKTFNFSNISDDALVSVFLKAFDVMLTILKTPENRKKILRTLETLESERSISFRFEDTNEPSIRYLMFGIIESLHLTLLHLTKRRNEKTPSVEISNLSYEESTHAPVNPVKSSDDSRVRSINPVVALPTMPKLTQPSEVQPTEESVDVFQSVTDSNEGDNEHEVKEEEMLDDVKDELPLFDNSQNPKDEPVGDYPAYPNKIQIVNYLEHNTTPDYDIWLDFKENEESDDVSVDMGDEKEDIIDNCDESKSESAQGRSKKRTSSSSMKGKRDLKKKRVSVPNEVQCPECDYRSHSAGAWVAHLRIVHSTTPVQAGYILRCDCGNESQSSCHSYKCHSNVTIMKGQLTKTIDPEKNYLKCPECEYFCGAARTWLEHLKNKHSTTPAKAGYILRCECGHESHSATHSYECDISKFTVKKGWITKISDSTKNELQCFGCEYRSQNVGTWLAHLRNNHSIALYETGFILRCDCGDESYSAPHSYECDIANFTVVREDD